MNIYFSKIIKVADRLREFNFRQLSSGDDLRYHVDVTDERGNRLIFNMYKDSTSHWKTASQKLPLWVHNAEELLGSAIDEELSQMNHSK